MRADRWRLWFIRLSERPSGFPGGISSAMHARALMCMQVRRRYDCGAHWGYKGGAHAFMCDLVDPLSQASVRTRSDSA